MFPPLRKLMLSVPGVSFVLFLRLIQVAMIYRNFSRKAEVRIFISRRKLLSLMQMYAHIQAYNAPLLLSIQNDVPGTCEFTRK